jgi:hypothetical protein
MEMEPGHIEESIPLEETKMMPPPTPFRVKKPSMYML